MPQPNDQSLSSWRPISYVNLMKFKLNKNQKKKNLFLKKRKY